MYKPYLIYWHMDASPATCIAGCMERVRYYGLRPGQYEIKLTGHSQGYWLAYGLYVDNTAKLKVTKQYLSYDPKNTNGYGGRHGRASYNRIPHKELYYG